MKSAHYVIGFVLIVIFLTTGRFMRSDFPDKDLIEQELRMLMRSRHIYILFSGLIHLLLGAYSREIDIPRVIARLKQLGSVALIASSILLIYAFFHEIYLAKQFSNCSRYGIFLAVAGVTIHVLSEVRLHNRNKAVS